MNIAIVDIGSNTVKLVIYDSEKKYGRIFTQSRYCKLVSYLENGIMNESGIVLLCDALKDFNEISKKMKCKGFFAFATASLRRTKNRDEVIKRVKDSLNIDITVLSGEEEANCSFSGALWDKSIVPDNGLVFDMGGGSTEIIQYSKKCTDKKISLGFGSLSLNIDFANSDFPDKDGFERVKEYISSLKISEKILSSNAGVCAGGTALKLVPVYCKYFKTETVVMEKDKMKTMLEDYISGSEILKKIIRETSPEREKILPMGLAAYIYMFDELGIEKCTVVNTGVREGFLSRVVLKGERL